MPALTDYFNKKKVKSSFNKDSINQKDSANSSLSASNQISSFGDDYDGNKNFKFDFQIEDKIKNRMDKKALKNRKKYERRKRLKSKNNKMKTQKINDDSVEVQSKKGYINEKLSTKDSIKNFQESDVIKSYPLKDETTMKNNESIKNLQENDTSSIELSLPNKNYPLNDENSVKMKDSTKKLQENKASSEEESLLAKNYPPKAETLMKNKEPIKNLLENDASSTELSLPIKTILPKNKTNAKDKESNSNVQDNEPNVKKGLSTLHKSSQTLIVSTQKGRDDVNKNALKLRKQKNREKKESFDAEKFQFSFLGDTKRKNDGNDSLFVPEKTDSLDMSSKAYLEEMKKCGTNFQTKISSAKPTKKKKKKEKSKPTPKPPIQFDKTSQGKAIVNKIGMHKRKKKEMEPAWTNAFSFGFDLTLNDHQAK